MGRFHFRILDELKRTTAESDIDEVDVAAAVRAISIALLLFMFDQGIKPSGFVELDDEAGVHVASIEMENYRQS